VLFDGNGKIGNDPADGAEISTVSTEATGETLSSSFQSEDDVKRGLQRWLEAAGWRSASYGAVARGLDMEARRADARWIIEVKGQGILSAMRVDYFLSILGGNFAADGGPTRSIQHCAPRLAAVSASLGVATFMGDNPLLSPAGFGVAPAPWTATQRAAWAVLRKMAA
jgi:hypothetical protein